MSPDYPLETFKAALNLGVAIVSLLLAAFIGNWLTAVWNFRQKRKELNLESVHELHDLYGELKEVVKLWRLSKRPLVSPVLIPPDERWKLLARACALESKAEALVLRLATERILAPGEATTIGLFRQAIQTLRECIRDDVDSPLGSRREEYDLLNSLAPQVSSIVGRDDMAKPPSAKQAQSQLANIVKITSNSWSAEIARMKAAKPEGEPA